jgi:hypothetical protein
MTSHLLYALATIGAMTCLICAGFLVIALFTEARRYTRRKR